MNTFLSKRTWRLFLLTKQLIPTGSGSYCVYLSHYSTEETCHWGLGTSFVHKCLTNRSFTPSQCAEFGLRYLDIGPTFYLTTKVGRVRRSY